MSKIFTNLVRLLVASVLMALASATAAQQAYPNKAIRFIVPFPPGGSTDPLARIVGQKLTEAWAQQVLIDNRPGGNTVIGTEALVKSPPDGYTILYAGSTHIINSLLYHNLPYDSIKDFAPVTTLTRSQYVLVLHPSVPANNLQEFIALAKSKPGQLDYGTSGTGNPNHLAMELFSQMTGIKMQHVPYKGAAPAVVDLLSGRVQVFCSVPASFIPYIQSGRLKAIGITGETRSPALPQVPTFAESGLASFAPQGWGGVVAPAGTPKAIINKLAAEIARILSMPDTKEKLVAQGHEAFITTPEEFAALMRSDMAKYSKIITTANIKIEQ